MPADHSALASALSTPSLADLFRDFHDVTPVRGVFYGGGDHRLDVEVDVDRVPAPA